VSLNIRSSQPAEGKLRSHSVQQRPSLDFSSAAKAFELALVLDSASRSSTFNIPRKWIREDLARVRQKSSEQQQEDR